jgi:hypothetical protein
MPELFIISIQEMGGDSCAVAQLQQGPNFALKTVVNCLVTHTL